MFRGWLIRSLFLLPVLRCVAGWGWSYNHRGWIGYYHRSGRVGYDTYSGVVAFRVELITPAHPFSIDWGCEGLRPEEACILLPNDYGFYWGFAWDSTLGNRTYISAPYWFLLLFFGALLFLVWRKTRPKLPGGAFPVATGTPVQEQHP